MRKLEVIGIELIKSMFPNINETKSTISIKHIDIDQYIAKIFSEKSVYRKEVK